MVLFVSDLHFDWAPPPDDPLISGGREAERDLLDCLRSHRQNLTHVILLGDLFDAWIEYRELIPKGLTRLFGTLAVWADEGLDVTVVVGNHDPWHRDYLETELGFRVLRESRVQALEGHRVAFGHGDREENGGKLSLWHRFIRSRFIHTLYAEVLPGSFGQWLARMWSRGARTSRLDHDTVDKIRAHAAMLLGSGYADVAVFGHCHQPERTELPGGVYVNTGSWALSRSYALLDADGIRLLRWNADAATRPGRAAGDESASKPVSGLASEAAPGQESSRPKLAGV